MKKLVVILFFILISQSGFAQLFRKEKILNNENFDKDRFSYGYFLGFNSYDFNFDYTEDAAKTPDILVDTKLGFSVGLLGNLRFNDYIDLRFEPGLYITSRQLYFPDNYFDNYTGALSGTSLTERDVKSTYLHFPLLFKFSTKRLNNFKPFVLGGGSVSLNLNSNENNPDDNFNGQFRMTKTTFYYELGFGIDFYLHYFKFTPSIRGVFAINDELIRDDSSNGESPWTDHIDSMKTRGIFVNFTFQ